MATSLPDFTITPLGTYSGFSATGTGQRVYVNDYITSSNASIDDVVTTSYVYTFINNLGEESAPSPPSDLVRHSSGLTTVVSGIYDPSGDEETDYGLTNDGDGTKRLYRSATGADGSTAFFFVSDIPYGTEQYTDNVPDSSLGEELETEDWQLPPEDGHSILSLPNGITVMASGNQICPSVQNRPHSYPEAYKLTCDFPIVGLGAIDTTIVVLTEANPYIIVGSDPAQLSMAKLELPYGCVSKRSIASLKGYGVIYASPNGLVSINGAGVNLITNNLFSREQWQALGPENIYGYVHDDRYFFFFNP